MHYITVVTLLHRRGNLKVCHFLGLFSGVIEDSFLVGHSEESHARKPQRSNIVLK